MKKNNNSFISAIASGANLNDLAKNEPKGKEVSKTDEEEKVNEVQIEEQQEKAEDVIKEVKPFEVSKLELVKKTKSKNNKEFIENIIALHNQKTEKTNEKTSLLVTPQLHYKLKMLAFSSKVNLFDLTNAIFTSFLDDNKDDIDALMKKMM